MGTPAAITAMDAKVVTFLAIFAVFSASLAAADEEEVEVRTISCYTCTNSIVPNSDGELDDYYSAGCVDEFNPSGAAANVAQEECDGRAPKCFKSKATMVDGGVAYQLITRGCADPGTEDIGCSYNKAATKGETHLCFCNTDNCNGAAEMGSHVIMTTLAAVLSVFVYRLF